MRRGAQTVLFLVLSVIGLAGVLYPFVIPIADEGGDGPTGWIVLLVLLVLPIVALLFLQLGSGGMGPKAIALLGMLGAVMVAMRLPGFIFGFNMAFIVVLLAGNAFGPRFGFLLGAIGIFVSDLFLGFGPWTPFVMIAMGWVGLGAGLLPRRVPMRLRIGLLALYGAVVGLAFGAVSNLYFWPLQASGTAASWEPHASLATNVQHYATFYVTTSLPWDIWRTMGNVIMVLLLGRLGLAALDRAAKRMRLDIIPDIEDAPISETSSVPEPPVEVVGTV